jgi:hypothetical protein
MTPLALLTTAQAAGLTVALEAGALRVRGPAPALARWAPTIRTAKPGLIALLTPRPHDL